MISKLLTKCLHELATNEKARERFNQISFVKCYIDRDKDIVFWDGEPFMAYTENFQDRQIYIIIMFLSRTKDGDAVMSFLDVDTETIIDEHIAVRVDNEGREYGDPQPIFLKLLDLLRREFTEAIGNGKTVDEALEIIDKIYSEYDPTA